MILLMAAAILGTCVACYGFGWVQGATAVYRTLEEPTQGVSAVVWEESDLGWEARIIREGQALYNWEDDPEV